MKRPVRSNRVVLVTLAALGVVVTAAASQAKTTKTCLTGTDPSVANDKAQITAVRALVDNACPCAGFDGTKGKTHRSYMKCVGPVVNSQVPDELRAQCKGVVKGYYAKSTCGKNPNQHFEPCISTSLKNGKVTCAIKPTTKKDGTTANPACSDTPKSTRVKCSEFSNCIDAADTNGDLIIAAPGDSGACVLRQGESCSDATNCASHHCIDGVCCDTACTGVCQACSAALTGGAEGTCAPAISGMDPHNDCAVDGAATCNHNGVCDGAGACALYPASTMCNAVTCNGLGGLTYNPADFCNGSGTCVDSGTVNCNDGNVCTDDSCSAAGCSHVNNSASCNDSLPCTVNDTCSGGTCAGTQLNPNPRAAITKEIDSLDANNAVHLTVELVTLTDLPFELTATGLDFPSGFSLESLGSTCSAEPTDYRCRHTAMLLATTACSDTGNYHLHLTYSCSPDASGCSLCSAPETIDFSLNGADFCTSP